MIGLVYLGIAIMCIAGANAQSMTTTDIICVNSTQAYKSLTDANGARLYVAGYWKEYSTLNGRRYTYVVSQADYGNVFNMCKVKNCTYVQPNNEDDSWYVFETTEKPNVLMPGVATMFDALRKRDNATSYDDINKKMANVVCTNSTPVFKNLRTANGQYTILGYWKPYSTPNGRRYSFVVNQTDFLNAHNMCRQMNYTFVQPIDDSAAWQIFELAGRPDILMPGVSKMFDGMRVRNNWTHFNNLSGQMTGVICVNSTTSSSPLKFPNGDYTIFGFWKSYTTPNGVYWTFAVNETDYNNALQQCKAKNYTYVQATYQQDPIWYLFELDNKPSWLMPGVSLMFDGMRSRANATHVFAVSKKFTGVFCVNNMKDYESLAYENGPYAIQGYWRQYQSPSGTHSTFVVNDTDYQNALKLCTDKDYKYVQPDDQVAQDWSVFEIDGNPQILMPGVSTMFDGLRQRDNPVPYKQLDRDMTDVVCANSTTSYESLSFTNGAYKIFGFWKSYNSPNGERYAFVVTPNAFETASQLCKRKRFQYVQPNDHTEYWYVFALQENADVLMPGVKN